MKQSLTASCFILFAVIAVVQSTALPVADLIDREYYSIFPEIIPGPGLPSLESLNLTSAELYAMPAPDFGSAALSGRSSSIEKRAQLCYNTYSSKCPIDWAVGCYNYLQNLGTTGCGGFNQWFSMCSIGPCVVSGKANGNGISVSSYCRDVAYGVSVIAYTCPHDSLTAGAGIDVAWGNGDFLVELVMNL